MENPKLRDQWYKEHNSSPEEIVERELYKKQHPMARLDWDNPNYDWIDLKKRSKKEKEYIQALHLEKQKNWRSPEL